MKGNKKPIANPNVVLREEFDDWAVLFNLDTDHVFGLDPMSVFIWKYLDGKHTVDDIIKELSENCKDIPKDPKKYIENFIKSLVKKRLVRY